MMKRGKIFLLIVLFNINYCYCQNDSIISDTIIRDSIDTITLNRIPGDTIQITQKAAVKTYQSIVIRLLQQHKYLLISDDASVLLHNQKKEKGKEFLFYILSIIILLLGIFKTFYSGYFDNIFRVFFNTSLRQNQLTDILLQARLPSLLFNIFFIIISGFYMWLVLMHYHLLAPWSKKILIPVCIASIGLIYFCKFLSLKFIGWVSGMKEITDTYIFVTFLINKIAGIILIPFLILLAFSEENWGNIIILLSFLTMIVLFLMRFFRSYGLVANQLSVSRLHFLIYIFAVEILPLFLIYKLVIKTLV